MENSKSARNVYADVTEKVLDFRISNGRCYMCLRSRDMYRARATLWRRVATGRARNAYIYIYISSVATSRDIFGCMAISSLLHTVMHSQIASMPSVHQNVNSCARITYVRADISDLASRVCPSVGQIKDNCWVIKGTR